MYNKPLFTTPLDQLSAQSATEGESLEVGGACDSSAPTALRIWICRPVAVFEAPARELRITGFRHWSLVTAGFSILWRECTS
jgi:hypothetical protein